MAPRTPHRFVDPQFSANAELVSCKAQMSFLFCHMKNGTCLIKSVIDALSCDDFFVQLSVLIWALVQVISEQTT